MQENAISSTGMGHMTPGSSDTSSLHDLRMGVVSAAKAVYTLVVAPPHDAYHRDVAQRINGASEVPLQPRVPDMIEAMRGGSLLKASSQINGVYPGSSLLNMAGTLVQFTDYVPTLHDFARTPYADVDSLFNGVLAEHKKRNKRLDFNAQLDIALRQTDGDLHAALWRLCITSRLHARWLDTRIVSNIPKFEPNEAIDRMCQWSDALLACKDASAGYQDVSGDTYYAWTHAFAKVVFTSAVGRQTPLTKAAVKIFDRGTNLMQGIVHSLNPQSVPNSHRLAAEYGNAMGKLCTEVLNPQMRDSQLKSRTRIVTN